MTFINRGVSIAVEVTLALFVVLLILAPFHGRATQHFAVTQTLEETLVAITYDPQESTIERGQRLTLYRFNSTWKAPIGTGVVESVANDRATLRIDPRDMSWPIGRHGLVFEEDGRTYVSLGTTSGLHEGDALHIFRDRESLGQVSIIRADASRSEIALPIGVSQTDAPLFASEYQYATQVTLFDNGLLTALEIAVMALTLLGYALTYLRTRRSPFIVLGEALRRIPLSRQAFFWITHLIAGIPFTWFVVKMPLYFLAYLSFEISRRLSLPSVYLYDDVTRILPYAYALIGALYYGYLAYRQRSPILTLWRWISYQGTSGVQRVSFQRGIILWALHLIIVYAFASTLLGFLRGDIQAALAIGFPAPTIETWFEQAKFLIWALTVVGVLIGYGYSVLSILWGKYIRNLDFTVTGWLTNGFCYPLFGIVIWQMSPAFTGIDPIITAGPLLYLMLILGLVLNLLYMLSIFNLGILFDLMTDKGVRTSGFYSVMRHPNYTLEACMFFVTELVGLAAGVQWLGLSMYLFLYWIRSEREDNFMQWSNPDYALYQKKTPWKFIPGIY